MLLTTPILTFGGITIGGGTHILALMADAALFAIAAAVEVVIMQAAACVHAHLVVAEVVAEETAKEKTAMLWA